MASEKLAVIVTVTLGDNGRSIVEIGFLPNQRKLSIKEYCHILAGGISLLIKSSSQGDGEEDYKIMKDVIDQLHDDFISNDSYKDATFIKNNGLGG
jgi:hypothetical protein